jgi:hypothetical protein
MIDHSGSPRPVSCLLALSGLVAYAARQLQTPSEMAALLAGVLILTCADRAINRTAGIPVPA